MSLTDSESLTGRRDREADDVFDRFEFLKADTDGVLTQPTVSAPPVWTDLRSMPRIGRPSDLERARRRLNSPKDRRRTASLLVLLAYLPGVPFDEAAELVGTSPSQLLRWIRGLQTVPVKKFHQIEQFAEVLRHLHRVLEPWATRQWLHAEIPALGGLTPVDVITRRRFTDLLTVARGYTEPSVFD
jgi:hypothetical protein